MEYISEGYIKLYRKLLDNPIFQNEKLLKVFVWCLLKASHKGYEQLVGLQKITLQPGQFVYGRKMASEELKIAQTTLNRFMIWLKDDEILDIKTNNKFSVVTVVNWALYQVEEQKVDSKMDNKWTTNGQQMDTNKNVKNVNKTYCAFFEQLWGLYPVKIGKGQVSETQKQKLEKVGIDHLTRCIERYKRVKPEWQVFQNGSTFFNSGYVDYLDENFTETKPHQEPSKYRDMTNYEPGGDGF